ncbi:FixH family protein [Cupriavidus respiraculi]|uniref:Transmembrane lipoprotein n=1 Tax=Cupriavidus respiraculi TaxID=195930 RepID=A0ABM8XK97_9BURK|nr:FixH family protein [Cupriavidus respiraculi]MBY4946802.1 FixH family protein [Cupriavidus respiraculi]CAG9180623.1 hypothetical protein LMG21510_04069 [Cupriavidus respiraculi]
MQIEQTDSGRPWWKEPWPWLLMSGPLVAMAGCAVTIWLAMQHADTPIVDGVQRRGLVIEQAGRASGAQAPAADTRTAGRP